MDEHNKILLDIEVNLAQVISEKTVQGKKLWQKLLAQHPADIAQLIDNITTEEQRALIDKLPLEKLYKVFEKLSHVTQIAHLEHLNKEKTAHILQHMHSDNLVDLLAHLTDEELEKNLKLLQRKHRQHILSLLSFDPQSAGGIMNSDILTFRDDQTVKKSIDILQRLTGHQEVRYRIFVTDNNNKLIGYLTLEKLVISKPDTQLKNLLSKPELIISCDEDQETVVQQMAHYDLLSVPVVDKENHFLGVITADDVFDIIEEEASEDVYKMSGVGRVSHSYFETPASSLFFERSKWLIGLLLLQSVSSFIMGQFEDMLNQHVIISLFLTMLIGTGGNAGNQSATLVIRGLATGEIPRKKGFVVLFREFGIGLFIASLLSLVSFLRVYFVYQDVITGIAISLSLFLIVLTSMILGTVIPLLLERFNIDPAHSAAPFLSTLMDIIGITIYCLICSQLLSFS